MKPGRFSLYGGSAVSDVSSPISIEERIRPLLLSMKVCGLYFEPRRCGNKDTIPENDHPTARLLPEVGCRVYSYTVLSLLWMNVVRSAVALFLADAGLFSMIIQGIWYVQCASNATIFIVSCENLNLFRAFYQQWDRLYNSGVSQGIGIGFRCPVRYLRIATLVGWLVFLYNCIALNIFLYSTFDSSRDLAMGMLRPFPDALWARILQTVVTLFNTAAWSFPVIFVVIVARIIREQFLLFGTALSSQIEEAGDRMPERLPDLRIRYMRLCQALEVINRTFKWMLGTSFFLGIILICFISYSIINSPLEVFYTVTNVFWLLTIIIYILSLTISSSDVHDAAHELLDHIFLVGTKDATTSQLSQLNLFMTKLTGTSIGFTAVDFFVITKEFLLTLSGLYVTYFFLLLQFKIR